MKKLIYIALLMITFGVLTSSCAKSPSMEDIWKLQDQVTTLQIEQANLRGDIKIILARQSGIVSDTIHSVPPPE